MDYSSIDFSNPAEPADPSHKRCLTQLSFQAGLTEKMTSFTVGWSMNNMGPKFSGDVQGFEIPGLGREQLHDVDRIQLQDNSSTSSEQTAPNENLGRKRKACKDLTNTSPDVKKSKGDENTAKRSRTLDNASKELSSISEHSGNLSPKDSTKESYTKQQQQQQQQEPPKDYIHVRARRGQATDSHSLAERVRREKISERMKFLQGLVPGCSKVTGKAVMLDEIINYVQSLQCQIEFLSMKLAAVDSRNMENLLNKELAAQATRSPETTLLGPDPLASYRDYSLHMQIQPQINDHCNMDLRSVNGILCEHACLGRSPVLPPQMAYSDNFVGSLPQMLTGVCDGDLQTVVQMGNRKDFFGQGVNGRSFISPGLSKVEY